MFFFLLFPHTFFLFYAQISYLLEIDSSIVFIQINFHQDFELNKDHGYNLMHLRN